MQKMGSLLEVGIHTLPVPKGLHLHLLSVFPYQVPQVRPFLQMHRL